MALDIIVSNPDITVLGPPDSINVQLDIGPQGIRGTKFFSGAGDPASNPTITDAILNDLYLRTDPSGAGYVYQYLPNITGALQWYVVFQLDPVIYNARENVTFSEGTGSLVIPIYFVVGNFNQTLNLSSLSVIFSPEYDKPTAISLSSRSKVNEDADIEFEWVGREYDSVLDEWRPIDNPVTMNLSISFVTITTDLEPPPS